MKRTKLAVAFVAAAMTVTSMGISALAASTGVGSTGYAQQNPTITTNGYWEVTSEGNTTNDSNAAGIGGKNTGDKSLKLTFNPDSTETAKDQTVKVNINCAAADVTDNSNKVTYEVGVYRDNTNKLVMGPIINSTTVTDVLNPTIQFVSNTDTFYFGTGSGDFYNATNKATSNTFGTDYSQYVSSNTLKIPYTTVNRWVKYAFTVDFSDKSVAVRIDGKLIGTIATSRIKSGIATPTSVSGFYLNVANAGSTEGFIAVDDFIAYKGDYVAKTVPAFTAGDASVTVTTDNQTSSLLSENTIAITNNFAWSAYTNYLTKTVSGSRAMCLNYDMEQIQEVKGGSTIMVENTNIADSNGKKTNMYRYYTVSSSDTQFYLTVDGAARSSLKAGVVNVTLANNTEDGKMIVGVFNGDNFEQAYVNDTATDGNTITFTLADATNRTLKCMFWEDLDTTLSPIIDAEVF